MTFQIESPTTAKLLDIHVLSQKNRSPDENPGIQLVLALKLSNHMLAGFDGSLKSFLFTKTAATQAVANRRKDTATETLEGVEAVSDLPNLSKIGSAVKSIKWGDKATGMTLTIGFATGKQIELDDVVADRFRISPQEGGTVLLNFIVEAPDAREIEFAKLAKFKSREFEITLTQHEPAQTDVEQTDQARGERLAATKKTKAAKPDATAEFVRRNQRAAGAH